MNYDFAIAKTKLFCFKIFGLFGKKLLRAYLFLGAGIHLEPQVPKLFESPICERKDNNRQINYNPVKQMQSINISEKKAFETKF